MVKFNHTELCDHYQQSYADYNEVISTSTQSILGEQEVNPIISLQWFSVIYRSVFKQIECHCTRWFRFRYHSVWPFKNGWFAMTFTWHRHSCHSQDFLSHITRSKLECVQYFFLFFFFLQQNTCKTNDIPISLSWTLCSPLN